MNIIDKSKFILAALSTISLAISAGEHKTVCDHPVDYLQDNTELQRIHAAFDGKVERRTFSEVHYYPKDPHLTIGMGHWTYENISALFKNIRDDGDTWNEMLEAWASSLTPAMWAEFNIDAKTKGTTRETLEAGLTSLLCINKASPCMNEQFKPWSIRRGEQFNEESNWFRAGWKKVSRIPAIARIQADHWLNTVVLPSQTVAVSAGASTLGGIAVFSSARSSSTSISNSIAKVVSKVTKAPTTRNGEPDQVRLLEDWRSVVAWAEYVKVKKGDIRPRMREIWRAYFEGSWGKMPSRADDIINLKHTGCYMARGTIEDKALFRSDFNAACHEIPPPAVVAACLK